MRQTLVLFLIVLCSAAAHAQEVNDLDSLLNLSAFSEESELQKKLNQATNVASGKALSTRETPGILSVITAEEIMKSGARDITDILRLVPGFEIMQDLQFVTGVGFRGSWANEGKVLFLLDGHQVNDLLYQTVPLLNNFAVDAIDKIEIIRGPGSAIYGGSAEYAVINIVTKQAASLNGLGIYGSGGFHKSATGRTNGGFMAAQKGEKFSWDLGAFRSMGIVSDQPYTDLIGDVPDAVDLSKFSNANSTNINLGFKAGGLSVRGMYVGYDVNDPVYYTTYDNYSVDAKYDWKISDKLTITPQVIHYNQVPWSYGDEATGELAYKIKAVRNSGGLTFNQSFGRKTNLTYGALFFQDKATSDFDPDAFEGGELEMTNYAVFAQGLYKHRLFNLTAGFRYEHNSRAGGAFVPRLAFTKKIENFHFKLLYSQSFRTPAIENISLAANNPVDPTKGLVPERSQVAELELGYQFTPDMLLAVNAFDIETKDVIFYYYDPNTDSDWYENFKKTGSRGVEAIYSVRQKKWNAQLTYSYTVAKKTDPSNYSVPQTNTSYMGFPKHKFSLTSSVDITKKLSINPTVVASGKRYAFTEVDVDDASVSTVLPSYTLLNLFVNYTNLVQGLNMGVGVYDLFNERPGIPQPYDGGYLPIPGRSREFVVKLSYQFNFKGR
jgi:outer membrane receptor for ferrienterochelin and colicin